VVWCGFDENLEQGARYKRQQNNYLNPHVFARDFAAKLPTAPQLTVYASHFKDLKPRECFDKLNPNGGGLNSQTRWAAEYNLSCRGHFKCGVTVKFTTQSRALFCCGYAK
jgi:hypothetical protein